MDRSIKLDGMSREEDLDAAELTHAELFGHEWDPGPNGRCQHESHVALRRAMEGDGVDLEIDFDPGSIAVHDEVGVLELYEAYDRRVEFWRQRQAELRARKPEITAERRRRDAATMHLIREVRKGTK